MTFDEYTTQARRTWNGAPDIIVAALGLTGEAGEFAEQVKKQIAQGHPFSKAKLSEEIGDVLWYCSLASDAIGISLDDIAQSNISKLRARYPNGFDSKRSIDRKRIPYPEGDKFEITN